MCRTLEIFLNLQFEKCAAEWVTEKVCEICHNDGVKTI